MHKGKGNLIALTSSNSTFWGFFTHPWFLPSPGSLDFLFNTPHPLIKATPSQGSSSPKYHSPHFPTVLSSQKLLSSCTRREFCLFPTCVTWSEEPDWLTGTKMDIPENRRLLDRASFLPHRTGSWACRFSLTENGSPKKSQWNNFQVHYQYQLSALRLNNQKSNSDRNKHNTFPSCPLSCPSSVN